ncbi:hypothetical protein C0993_012400, partial [Termitomyces sp. T159_Od127]
MSESATSTVTTRSAPLGTRRRFTRSQRSTPLESLSKQRDQAGRPTVDDVPEGDDEGEDPLDFDGDLSDPGQSDGPDGDNSAQPG